MSDIQIEIINDEKLGRYMSVNGCNFYKNQFASLNLHSMIVELYYSCKNGLEGKTFNNTATVFHRKLTISQEIEYKNNILRISDSGWTSNDGHMFCNVENMDDIIKILQYILNCLIIRFPWINDGFEEIICFKNDQILIDNKIIKEFELTHKTQFVDDCHKGIHSIVRKDKRIHEIIINQQNEKSNNFFSFPKYLTNFQKTNNYNIFIFPKCLTNFLTIKQETTYGDEYIHFNQNDAIANYIYTMFDPYTRPVKYDNDEKAAEYDKLHCYVKFVTGSVVREKNDQS